MCWVNALYIDWVMMNQKWNKGLSIIYIYWLDLQLKPWTRLRCIRNPHHQLQPWSSSRSILGALWPISIVRSRTSRFAGSVASLIFSAKVSTNAPKMSGQVASKLCRNRESSWTIRHSQQWMPDGAEQMLARSGLHPEWRKDLGKFSIYLQAFGPIYFRTWDFPASRKAQCAVPQHSHRALWLVS